MKRCQTKKTGYQELCFLLDLEGGLVGAVGFLTGTTGLSVSVLVGWQCWRQQRPPRQGRMVNQHWKIDAAQTAKE